MSKQQIKIFYIIGQLSTGGTEQQLLALVKHLDKEKFDPTVICLSEIAPLAEEFIKYGCQVYTLERWSRGRITALIRLIRHLIEKQPDILQSFSYL